MMHVVTTLHPDVRTRCLFAVLAGANSVREVQAAVGVASTSTVHYHLTQLQRHGLVTWEAGKQRTLRPAVKVVTDASRSA